MRKIKIVSDSSSDLLMLDNVEFASSPMKIITAKREFVDVKYTTSLVNVARWSSGLRLRPLTPATWVRIPYGSPFLKNCILWY